MPGPTVAPRNELGSTLEMLSPTAQILDVGGGGRRIRPGVIEVDYVPVPGVDVVGDIHRLPLADNSFDCVICTGTLEHVANPWQAVSELCRVLKPGGLVHIDVPFMQAYHADPTDYWRFTLDGLRLLCREFEELVAGVHIGPSSALVWITREWVNSLSDNRYLSNLMLLPVAWLMAPLKYLDYWLIGNARAHRAASAVFFRGRKRTFAVLA